MIPDQHGYVKIAEDDPLHTSPPAYTSPAGAPLPFSGSSSNPSTSPFASSSSSDSPYRDNEEDGAVDLTLTRSRPIPPAPPFSNHISIIHRSTAIKGSYAIDTSLSIPPALLDPFPAPSTSATTDMFANLFGGVEGGGEKRRPNARFSTSEGAVDLTLFVKGGGTAVIGIENQGYAAKGVHLAIAERDRSTTLHLSVTSTSSIMIALPSNFRGVIKGGSDRGTLSFSPALKPLVSTFSVDQHAPSQGRYFLGDWAASLSPPPSSSNIPATSASRSNQNRNFTSSGEWTGDTLTVHLATGYTLQNVYIETYEEMCDALEDARARKLRRGKGFKAWSKRVRRGLRKMGVGLSLLCGQLVGQLYELPAFESEQLGVFIEIMVGLDRVGQCGVCLGWHLVAVLSRTIDLKVTLNLPLTLLSALLPIFFTFLALSSDSGASRGHGWWNYLARTRFVRHNMRRFRRRQVHAVKVRDFGRVGEQSRPSEEEALLDGASRSDDATDDGMYPSQRRGSVDEEAVVERGRQLVGEAPLDPALVQAAGMQMEEEEEEAADDNDEDRDARDKYTTSAGEEEAALHRRVSPTNKGKGRTLSGSSSEPPRGRKNSISSTTNSGTTTGHSYSTDVSDQDLESRDSSDNTLSLSLNRLTKRRLLSGAYRSPLSIRAYGMELYEGFTVIVAIKGLVWAAAIVSMHHLGIAAINIPDGRVDWDLKYVLGACVIAFVVTSVACICTRNMETQLSRQLLFSTVAASGVFAFHFTSAQGASFVSSAPPEPNPEDRGYPPELPLSITVLAILACVLASGMLAHNATLSRNRLAELVLTKRRMWRVIAEKEAVDRAADLKQQFISVASHELRTPLFSCSGYAELLSRTDLSPEQTLYINNVLNACSSMNLIISNVLDFSKLERGNAESSAKPVCVDIRAMLEGLARLTEDRGASLGTVDIVVAVAADVPQTVFLDEAYATRVLMNLLSNSLKFTQSRGYVLVKVDLADNSLVFDVTDTGSGIPKRFRDALFEPYRQADSSLTRPHQGTGLGLSICKQLVERLDGTIEVESVEGEGTTFTVTLPFTHGSEPPEPLPQTFVAKTQICVAYTSPLTEKLLVSLLGSQGFKVVPLASKSVDDLVKNVHAVWCDVEMFEQSKTLQQLATRPNRPSILVTTSGVNYKRLGSATGLLVIKDPGIVLHRIVRVLQDPVHHMSTGLEVAIPVPKMLRFADLPMRSPPTPTMPPQSPVVTQKKCIMLVEDNEVNSLLGKRMLEKMGYEALIARHGGEAVELAKEERADAILMDCQMPVMDGHEATKKIREMEASGELTRRNILIALTANVTPEAERQCLDNGFDAFLPKPISFKGLRETIERYLLPEASHGDGDNAQ